MKVFARLKHIRISPKKIRLVTDLVRNMDVVEAEAQLKFSNKRAAKPVSKVLGSAIANAFHNFEIEKDNLFISEIQVNEGPTIKRWRARAMGRAAPIMKRTSHINLVLETKKEIKIKKKKTDKPEVIKLEKAEDIKKESPVEKVVAAPKGGEPRPDASGREEKSIPPTRPYSTTSKSKKKFFSRQTFGNVKKMFRRKSF